MIKQLLQILLLVSFNGLALGCNSAPAPGKATTPESQTSSKASPAPEIVVPPPAAAPTNTPTTVLPTDQTTAKAHIKQIDKTRVFELKKNQLHPALSQAKITERATDVKSKAESITKQWRYNHLTVLETKISSEVGAAEILVKNKSATVDANKEVSLSLIEGQFAGATGSGAEDWLIVDGAELEDGFKEFQIFSVAQLTGAQLPGAKKTSSKELIRDKYNPQLPWTLKVSDQGSELSYHTALKVRCALLENFDSCWRKILKDNGSPRGLKPPDCKSAFAAARAPTSEWPELSAKKVIPNLANPRPTFAPGTVFCSAPK